MKVKDFYYHLPEELIAQTPLADREASRLMVLDKKSGDIEHRNFRNIVEYLNPGDCLVLNDTRVIPARLIGEREDSGGKMEFLLLERLEMNRWKVLVKPGKRAKLGSQFTFGDGILKAQVEEIIEDGIRIISFQYEGIFEEILDRLGEMPLPPYITEKLEDKERYQTVYSKNIGSSAAPTAGLHFTKEMLERIQDKGVNIAYITLHVGLGTFRPVKVEDIESHNMHSEFYMIDVKTRDIINATRNNGGRIIAVGTTSARTLETVGTAEGKVVEGQGWTDIFIYPGYQYKVVDCLITNFHLPESTLIMLISALSGRDNVLRAYNQAVEEKYRFFSFGDCMLIK